MTFTLTKEQAEDLIFNLRMVLSSLDDNEKIFISIPENEKKSESDIAQAKDSDTL